jgi:predicted membrane channel-forming protein YqfA (hemolysin III family)
MQPPENKLVTPASLAIDAVLCIAFFIYMYTVVSTHVPSKDHRMVLFFGASCSACMTMVFWLALQMFRVVVKGQQRRDAAAK